MKLHLTPLLFCLLSGCASYEIVGYYPAWKGPIEVDASLLTVVNYAFLVVGPDGALVVDNPAVDEPHFARLAALKAKHPHAAAHGIGGRLDAIGPLLRHGGRRPRRARAFIAILDGIPAPLRLRRHRHRLGVSGRDRRALREGPHLRPARGQAQLRRRSRASCAPRSTRPADGKRYLADDRGGRRPQLPLRRRRARSGWWTSPRASTGST